MRYTKSIGGPWLKASDLKTGDIVTIVAETTKKESRFTNDDGTPKLQDVTRVRVNGKEEAFNMNLNRATIYGLIDAFGDESKSWVQKPLTAHIERVAVAGKRVSVVYLVPEGFEVGENDEGFIEIVKKGDNPQFADPMDEVLDNDLSL